MLCFAVAVMAGVVAMRLHPGGEPYLVYGWLAFVLCLGAFLFPSSRGAAPADTTAIPESYVPHILPRPGFIASRGLNRFMVVACLGLSLLGAERQSLWRTRLDPGRLPEARWFDASLMADEPSRPHPNETGQWRSSARLLLTDGVDAGGVPVQLQGSGDVFFRRGDVVRARVRRLSTSPRAYPGAFDFAFYLERTGSIAILEVAKPSARRRAEQSVIEVIPNESPPFFTRIRRWVDVVRGEAIAATLDRGGREGGVLAAMLFGYRKDTAAEVRDAFRRVGIGHVLAISGLHVGLIVGLLWWLGGWIGWQRRHRAAGCLVLSIFYLGLTGGQVAATRATLMAVIHLTGIILGRKSDMLNSLGAAALFIVLANPTAPLDVSFQLSFIAVVFIYMALRRPADLDSDAARLRERPGEKPWRRRVRQELRSLILLSVATWVGLFPIIALVFNQVNLIGLPINIVVIPLMSLVLCGGLLLPWLGWIPGLSWLLALPSRLLTDIALFSDSLPGSSFAVHAPALGWTLLFYLFIGMLMLRQAVRFPAARRRWSMAALAGIGVASVGLVATMRSLPAPEDGRVAILPGRGMGVIVAEAPGGGIGLVGDIRRAGLNEAGWLHYLHRSGGVALLAVGKPGQGEYDALTYHYRIDETTVVVPTNKEEGGMATPWLPLPGAEGVEYRYRRDSRGRVFWVSARAGGKTATVLTRISAPYFAYLRRGDGDEADSGLFTLSFSEKWPVLPDWHKPGGWVGVRGRMPKEAPGGFFRRNDYGALVVGEGIEAFDGNTWHSLSKGMVPSTASVSPATASAVLPE